VLQHQQYLVPWQAGPHADDTKGGGSTATSRQHKQGAPVDVLYSNCFAKPVASCLATAMARAAEGNTVQHILRLSYVLRTKQQKTARHGMSSRMRNMSATSSLFGHLKAAYLGAVPSSPAIIAAAAAAAACGTLCMQVLDG
jgi:hypothetical protein